ncbi:MAG TPA: hypothetical protein VEX11_10635 [Acetobacteraceae bacterium]|nr:hypothetical protein [Acetobacteraceae bacterium]
MTKPLLSLLCLLLAGTMASTASAAPAQAPTATAVFSMYCYWTGEATLGRVPGVVRTRIGHLPGAEIVEVSWDPSRTDLGQLTAALKRQSSFYALLARSREERQQALAHLPGSEVKVESEAPDFLESKHSLRTRHPDLYYLDLTEAQAIALNSWSYFGGEMPDVLTPEQKALRPKLRGQLAAGQKPGLIPERTGPRQAAYRKALLAWLEG